MHPLDAARDVATVGAVLIALSPHIHKAFRLLTTTNKTLEEQMEQFEFMASDRVGWIQKSWYRLLDWIRTEDVEKLSWGEWWARRLWCPLAGHDLKERHRPAGYFQGICGNCHASKVMVDEDHLLQWARRGKVPFWDREQRVRERRPRKRRKVRR
jgi:hypothetical protein